MKVSRLRYNVHMDRFIASFKTVKKQCLVVLFIALVVVGFIFMGTTGIPVIQSIIRSLTPLWWAIGIAYVLNIPMSRLEYLINKYQDSLPKMLVKHKRGLCLTTTVILSLLALSILISIIIPQIVASLIIIFNNLSSTISYFITNINGILEFFHLETLNVQQDTQTFINWFSENFNVQNIVNQLGNLALNSSQSIIVTLTRVLGEFMNIFMGFLLSLYLLADKEKFVRALRECLAFGFTKNVALELNELFHDANTTFTDFVAGQFTEAIIFGTLCYIMMTLFNFPMAMLISVVASVLCLIPMFGPTLGMLFGALIILTSRPILTTIGFMVFYQVLQQIENNVIYPRIVGVKVGLPAVLVLLSIIVFGSFSGIVGMLVAVPVTAVLYNFYQKYTERYLTKNKIIITDKEIIYNNEKE